MRTGREFDARCELETSVALTVCLARMSKGRRCRCRTSTGGGAAHPPSQINAPTVYPQSNALANGHYPYSTRGRIVTIPGQIVSSSTKPTMIIRYGSVTRAM